MKIDLKSVFRLQGAAFVGTCVALSAGVNWLVSHLSGRPYDASAAVMFGLLAAVMAISGRVFRLEYEDDVDKNP